MKEIKELLKRFRIEELAVKLDCSASIINKWRSGERQPGRQNKVKIGLLLKKR